MTRILAALVCAGLCVSLTGLQASALEKKEDKKKEEKKVEKKKPMPSQPPTETIAYGKHPRQVIDFYQAKSEKPTPVVLYIHGGGWRGGDKNSVGNVKPYLDAGISVAAINYRYTQNGEEDKVVPPVKAPLEDAARALQFIRSKSKEWNIDKKRIGATGGSAGACSSLWLAFHNDMADPKSSDPIARESTRLWCAAVNGAQTTLDPKPLKEWLPNYTYGSHAFGLKTFDELFEKRESVLPWIKEYSPMEHATKDDPPIGLFYGGDKDAKVGGVHKDPTHSPVMGMMLHKKLQGLGVESVLSYTGHADTKYASTQAFLIAKLTGTQPVPKTKTPEKTPATKTPDKTTVPPVTKAPDKTTVPPVTKAPDQTTSPPATTTPPPTEPQVVPARRPLQRLFDRLRIRR